MSRCFEKALHEFGHRMGLDGLRLDEQGHCALRFDAVHVHLQLLDDEEQVLCYCPLGRLDDQAQPAMAWEMLHAGFLYRHTGGASLSRDKESGECLLSCLIEGAHITVNGLEARMTLLVNTAELWMHRLHSAAPPPPRKPPCRSG
ncbi:type III secretion system chaperone [Comamonas endophytica]|uniref:type III secretion system chaperone n=1 Tax=Comamonas endophytica TaxID=2949090 RepID=UPI0036093769